MRRAGLAPLQGYTDRTMGRRAKGGGGGPRARERGGGGAAGGTGPLPGSCAGGRRGGGAGARTAAGTEHATLSALAARAPKPACGGTQRSALGGPGQAPHPLHAAAPTLANMSRSSRWLMRLTMRAAALESVVPKWCSASLHCSGDSTWRSRWCCPPAASPAAQGEPGVGGAATPSHSMGAGACTGGGATGSASCTQAEEGRAVRQVAREPPRQTALDCVAALPVQLPRLRVDQHSACACCGLPAPCTPLVCMAMHTGCCHLNNPEQESRV